MPHILISQKSGYSVIDGLGPLTDVYRMKAGATTTINRVPANATMKKYNDKGTNSGSTSSSLGSIVSLVNSYADPILQRTRLRDIFTLLMQ